MILTKSNLLKLIDDGIVDADKGCVDGITVDIHLHNSFLVEDMPGGFNRLVNLIKGEKPEMRSIVVSDCGHLKLPRNGFCLAMTKEFFKIPCDMTGMFFMKSSDARAGLDHSQSILLKPGWSGRLVLEIRNNLSYHEQLLTPGQEIGQVIFLKHDVVDGYQGKYNGQTDF
jgi:deoxycytidine triphosphate deaminase